eukprot:455057_1
MALQILNQMKSSDLKHDEIYGALENSELMKQMQIPIPIMKLITELSLSLEFIACSDKIRISKTEDGQSKVTMNSKVCSYSLAITDGVYSSGIHRYEVLVGPTPKYGCRYIGYVSSDGKIRLNKGMHCQDYWVGWDGSCKRLYQDYAGTENWNNAKSESTGEWKEGDKIMCELNCDTGILKYTKNGEQITVTAKGMKGRSWTPAVSLKNEGETITILWSQHD